MSAFDRLYGLAASWGFGLAWCAAYTAGAPREELAARRGFLPPADGPLFWFHGASAGEMGSAAELERLLRGAGFRFVAGYTTTNRAGIELITRRVGADAVVALGPWDAPRWVARAFDAWQPKALFLVETEIWPRLVLEADRRGIPVFCVSGRIYPRDVARYQAVRRWMAPTFRRLTAVLAQNASEERRFVALGASPERCFAAGSLKHLRNDGEASCSASPPATLGIGPGKDVIVFGSLHADEVSLAFTALDALPIDACRIVIAPRRRSAVAPVLRAARRRGWQARVRSRDGASTDWKVMVLDTMGELSQLYAVASVAVVGGGFGNHGGHNPLEPLERGAPVLFGPHFENFEEEATALVRAVPEARVTGAAELSERLRQWLLDPAQRRAVLAQQRAILPHGLAIGQRYLAILARSLTMP